ncbi:M48 family metallopeptidase [Streptomyces sp. NPDC059002]|uniref:M48 metallopeptidase family protein n=1 Tax=Streptomyces sp. NPDC059002 TaxID=3346690 RepID=UPI0036CC095B
MNPAASRATAPECRRLPQIADRHHAFKFSSVTGRALGYRWDSCIHRGVINVRWAVMQLPSNLIDYVLVYELAHLHQANHKLGFWEAVS